MDRNRNNPRPSTFKGKKLILIIFTFISVVLLAIYAIYNFITTYKKYSQQTNVCNS